ncbi:MAG: DUF4238 domain-containing protein [Bacteroidales bacterium]
MITEKKNQHYIPKFYLRNFSYHGNKKQIGVYNLNNDKFIQAAKLKTQGSKNFFYGYDGVVEDKLADLEGDLSMAINQITEKIEVPKKNTENHNILLAFVALTDLRNPVKVNGMKSMLQGMKEKLMELDPDVDIDKFVPNPNHDDIVKLLLSQSAEMILNTLDLDYKLLINRTSKPYITSDFPVVKYNQFLEEAKWQHSKSGYGTIGLQILIPLNSDLVLIFFDSGIYKVGDKKRRFLDINSTDDVDSINILQFINCFETIYFNEKASETYLRQLVQKSKKYVRANETKTELSYLIQNGDNQKEVLNGKQNLMIFGSTDCECKLKINGVKIHSNGRAYKFDNSIAQLRPHCKNLIKKTAANK